MTQNPDPLKNNQPIPISLEKGAVKKDVIVQKTGETGGQAGPEPTRFGDWEKGGRCTDF
ncbi:MAG: DUF1674 domain-containing protein [Alphaproteobacteria bacterium]|nr:DUF1674 domain-containing protein [Alphaproteobacteria bacterium]